MEQFSLEKYLENPSRKITTRYGDREVRIICTDRKDKRPIVALMIDLDDGSEYITSHSINGLIDDEEKYPDKRDLFFADEEKLTEFEEAIYQHICTIVTACDGEVYGNKELKPIVKGIAKGLLDLAKKQIEKEITKEVEQKAINSTYAYQQGYENGKHDALKDFPKLKKIPAGTSRKDLFDMMHKHVVLAFNDCVDYYYIDESDLRKLPKEE